MSSVQKEKPSVGFIQIPEAGVERISKKELKEGML